ncbi:endonuclease [Microcystis phage Mwe-JY25]
MTRPPPDIEPGAAERDILASAAHLRSASKGFLLGLMLGLLIGWALLARAEPIRAPAETQGQPA